MRWNTPQEFKTEKPAFLINKKLTKKSLNTIVFRLFFSNNESTKTSEISPYNRIDKRQMKAISDFFGCTRVFCLRVKRNNNLIYLFTV